MKKKAKFKLDTDALLHDLDKVVQNETRQMRAGDSDAAQRMRVKRMTDKFAYQIRRLNDEGVSREEIMHYSVLAKGAMGAILDRRTEDLALSFLNEVEPEGTTN